MSMEKRLDKIESELEGHGKLLSLIYNPDAKNGILYRIEESLDNHLRTHTNIWDKVFKVLLVVIQVGIGVLLWRGGLTWGK